MYAHLTPIHMYMYTHVPLTVYEVISLMHQLVVAVVYTITIGDYLLSLHIW
jgi:uncharacterized protein with PQ loop repeat